MRLLMLQRGLTLIELMVTVAIMALIAMAGAPMFSDYITNSRLREGGNALLAETLYAQSEAIKRNGIVRVAVSGADIQIIDRSVEGADAVLRQRPLPDGVLADAATNLDFGSQGTTTPFGTPYTVDLSISGISCTGDHRCPSLRVDAGGAIRLCGDKNNCS